jgi:hypothetical protein
LTWHPRLGKSDGEEDGCTAVPSELLIQRLVNVVLRASRRSRAGRASKRQSPATGSAAAARSGAALKALSARIGHSDVAFTMRQYVQTDLEADRQVASTLAALIIGGSLASIDITDETDSGGEDAVA